MFFAQSLFLYCLPVCCIANCYCQLPNAIIYKREINIMVPKNGPVLNMGLYCLFNRGSSFVICLFFNFMHLSINIFFPHILTDAPLSYYWHKINNCKFTTNLQSSNFSMWVKCFYSCLVTELHWDVAVSIETAAEISDRYSTIIPEIYQRTNKNTEMLFFGHLLTFSQVILLIPNGIHNFLLLTGDTDWCGSLLLLPPLIPEMLCDVMVDTVSKTRCRIRGDFYQYVYK